ncbi:MAG: HAD-IA family hydrolase [Betaproteobacteria bacterium]
MRDGATRRFDLIVFDWDGTLADSTAPIVFAMKEACRDLGIPVPDDIAARYVIGLGLADAMKFVAPALAATRFPELGARFRHHYLAREADIPLFAGARELLGELEAAGFLLAVATGKTRVGLARMLENFGLERAFHATRCADEGFPKPHPDMLLHLMDRLDVKPRATLMIGDTTHDLDLARNAGAHAVAVTYGAHSADELAPLSPLAAVQSVPELREWLKLHA